MKSEVKNVKYRKMAARDTFLVHMCTAATPFVSEEGLVVIPLKYINICYPTKIETKFIDDDKYVTYLTYK